MAIYNPLSWQNEQALTGYPFEALLDPQNFIVDAKFIQFDNFVPVLNYVRVNRDSLNLAITFDTEQITSLEFFKDVYTLGEAYQNLRIYTQDNSRYLGVIVFGSGAAELWSTSVGRKIVYDTPFSAEAVRSVPSQDAVYTLDGNYGDIKFGRSLDDTTIFFNTTKRTEEHPTALNAITFNAVANHAIPDNADMSGLRKINLVAPLNNNINLASNDTIKITTLNAASLTIDLVAGTASNAFILPTLIA